MKGTPLVFTLLSALALAHAQSAPPLGAFLEAVSGSPELAASRAALEAAELQLRAAYDPVALEATGGYSRFDLDDALLPSQQPPTGEISESATQFSATLRFRPLPFGDTADLVRQRELERESSLLDLREARTGLEARALEAALNAQLAARSASLAREGMGAAERSLEATRLRVARGAANARELREARSNLLEARALLEGAEADADLARENLRSLVGEATAPSFGALRTLSPPERGTPLSVLRARIPVEQAELGVGSAQRAVYPVAQASYAYNLSDESTLSASIESRTLQPSVGFSYADPGRSFPENAVRGTFQVGVSATISLGALDTLEAVKRQAEAVRAGLQAAREGAALQRGALESARSRAQRDLRLRRLEFQNAQKALQETRTRERLGLVSPLETQGALLEALQADLERRSAELAALSSLLDLYAFYALPPSEALP